MDRAQEAVQPGPRENPRESLAFGQFPVFWDDVLHLIDGGFEFQIRIPWYRSLPLSALQTLEMTLDGERIAPEAIRFQLYGERLALHELSALFTTWWFILDPASLHVSYEGELQPGEQYTIDLDLGFRIPYIMVGPNPLLAVNHLKKALTAVREDAP